MKRYTKIYLFAKNNHISDISVRCLQTSGDITLGQYIDDIATLLDRYTD